MTLRVAFTGGGTGGHVYPALAIDGALRAEYRDDAYEPRFFGNRSRIEATIVTGMPMVGVPSAPLSRANPGAAVRTALVNLAGIAVALRALAAFRPLMVVATGGFTCFPVIVAARILRALRLVRCGIALLEINVTPGLTNRLLAPLVDEVWITYPESAALFGRKAVVTGTPTRPSFRALAPPPVARERLGLDPAGTTIVAIGGSQGARTINEAVAALVTRRTLAPDWQVLHVCGERDYAYMQAEEREPAPGNRLRLVDYLADPADAYAAADVVVARAGASTLAELAVAGVPAVLVPYPHAAEAHQAHNAEAVARAGAAVTIADAELDGDRLWWTLREVLEPARNAAMRQAARELAPSDAAAAIVARIEARIPARVAGDDPANGGAP